MTAIKVHGFKAAKFKDNMVNARIRRRVRERKELKPADKLAVLKNARELLQKHYSSSSAWFEFIDGVEEFCLYGGLQIACGLAPDSAHDTNINACSLTTTLFDAIPSVNKSKQYALRNIETIERARYIKYEDKVERILSIKKSALQNINDDGDKKKLLRIVDRAIKDMEAQL